MSRSMFYRETAIPAAGTTATDPVIIGDAAMLEILGIFDYGSGGTTAKYYVQTSLDGGSTWFDIACLAYATADLTKVTVVYGDGYDGTALTDGSLADNTVMHGLIGDMLRVKQVIAGTYAASDMTLYVQAKREGKRSLAVAATAAVTSVNDQATSTTLLAANTSRKGAVIFNDSTSILYLKFGTTASATDFTMKLGPGESGYLTQPVYTGRIDGIWSADASGAARVTELT